MPDKTETPLATEIDWLRRFLNCSVFSPPPSEIQRAHAIVDKLSAANQRAQEAKLVARASEGMPSEVGFFGPPSPAMMLLKEEADDLRSRALALAGRIDRYEKAMTAKLDVADCRAQAAEAALAKLKSAYSDYAFVSRALPEEGK